LQTAESVSRQFDSKHISKHCRQHLSGLSSYTIFESLFIFSIAKLLLNAASYDGEIWHADAWRPWPGFMSIGVVVTKIMTYFQIFAAVSHLMQATDRTVGPYA